MNVTFRPMPRWPYPEQRHRPPLFKASYSDTLGALEREIEALKGGEVIIGLVTSPDQIRLDGRLRTDARVDHPGVELSFEIPGRRDPMTDQRAPGRRLVFHTDVHTQTTRWVSGGPARVAWKDNLRAIALGLEALRAVDRYGITSTAEQYAGFAQLTTSAPSAERGRALVTEAGGLTQALKRHHPDHGGDARAFADVQAFRQLTGSAS